MLITPGPPPKGAGKFGIILQMTAPPMTVLTPYTPTGEAGLRYIVHSKGVAQWVDANVEDLLAHGYTRITAEPYEPSGVYGRP